jgi:IclR family pca regulon transcriptional regulator
VLRLGQSYLLSARLPHLVQPLLRRLAAATLEAASLAVLDGHDVVYLARQGGTRVGFAFGARLPAHVVSVGRAMLAELADDELDRWIAGHDFAAFTRHTETDPDRFRHEIVRARAAGYAIADQELELGWRGLAITLRGRDERCIAAISITMPVDRSSAASMVQRHLPLMREAVAELRRFL